MAEFISFFILLAVLIGTVYMAVRGGKSILCWALAQHEVSRLNRRCVRWFRRMTVAQQEAVFIDADGIEWTERECSEVYQASQAAFFAAVEKRESIRF